MIFVKFLDFLWGSSDFRGSRSWGLLSGSRALVWIWTWREAQNCEVFSSSSLVFCVSKSLIIRSGANLACTWPWTRTIAGWHSPTPKKFQHGQKISWYLDTAKNLISGMLWGTTNSTAWWTSALFWWYGLRRVIKLSDEFYLKNSHNERSYNFHCDLKRI